MRRALTSSQELQSQSKFNLVCSICRVNRQEIINVVTPSIKGDDFVVKSVELMYFLKTILNCFCTSLHVHKTKYIIMITKEMSTNFKCHYPRVGVNAIGRGDISHIVQMYYFFNNLVIQVIF